MRLGIFMMPLHPPTLTMSEAIAEDTEKTIFADQLGYEEFWLGEHFAATTEPYPAAMMFMANLLSQTKNLKFGTGVVNLPNHDPAVVAAEVAQFDHMSGGNFMFGIGPGGLASDFELFNNQELDVRNRKVLESVDLIKKIWSQDPPYDLEGEFWNVRITDSIVPELGIGYMPKPLQQPHPPIHLSLASPHSSSAKVAAEQGWKIISANISPVYSVKSHWDIYSDACEAMERTPSGDDWSVARNIMIAPGDQEAKDQVFGENASSRYYFTYMRGVFSWQNLLIIVKPDPEMSDDEVTNEVMIEESVTYGSPKTVLDKLIAFRDHVGPFGCLLLTTTNWGGLNRGWEQYSMRALAEEVMPKFRQHIESQSSSA